MEKNLKPVPADKQKSLGKLPEDVRNRMGYAQKGKMMKAKKGKDVKLMENISKESLFGKGRLKTLKKAKDGKMMTFKEFVKQKSGAAVSDKELGNLKTAYMKKLSGAQVSDKEAEKLISMIPGKAKGGEMVKARKGKMMDKKNKNKKPGQILLNLKHLHF